MERADGSAPAGRALVPHSDPATVIAAAGTANRELPARIAAPLGRSFVPLVFGTRQRGFGNRNAGGQVAPEESRDGVVDLEGPFDNRTV
jgi:hypothetical protein